MMNIFRSPILKYFKNGFRYCTTCDQRKNENLPKIFYPPQVEVCVNKQIFHELKVSYNYLAMASYFARTTIGLPGTAKFFQMLSNDEYTHAQKIMAYQCLRGGHVYLEPIPEPEKKSFANLYDALNLSLVLEKNNAENINKLCSIAEKEGDITTQDWFLSNILQEQMEELQRLGTIIAKAKEVGPNGIGLYLMDQYFSENYTYNGDNPITSLK